MHLKGCVEARTHCSHLEVEAFQIQLHLCGLLGECVLPDTPLCACTRVADIQVTGPAANKGRPPRQWHSSGIASRQAANCQCVAQIGVIRPHNLRELAAKIVAAEGDLCLCQRVQERADSCPNSGHAPMHVDHNDAVHPLGEVAVHWAHLPNEGAVQVATRLQPGRIVDKAVLVHAGTMSLDAALYGVDATPRRPDRLLPALGRVHARPRHKRWASLEVFTADEERPSLVELVLLNKVVHAVLFPPPSMLLELAEGRRNAEVLCPQEAQVAFPCMLHQMLADHRLWLGREMALQLGEPLCLLRRQVVVHGRGARLGRDQRLCAGGVFASGSNTCGGVFTGSLAGC
mmetsp:Transcript_33453/g.77708  ORF Transcript_33453/g.77708 Transcript_33453/m.77708 type:complete len:345 (+) Transcript_33453:221-1255(+)